MPLIDPHPRNFDIYLKTKQYRDHKRNNHNVKGNGEHKNEKTWRYSKYYYEMILIGDYRKIKSDSKILDKNNILNETWQRFKAI